MSTAKANLDPDFDALLRAELSTGCSYPAARQRVIDQLVGADAHIGPPSENQHPSVLSNPNDLLAVEYCKAILKQGSPMKPLPIRRTGSYHADVLDPEAPSATALRAAIKAFPLGGRWPAGPDEGACRRATVLYGCTEERDATSSVIRLAGDAGCHLPLKGKALGEPSPDWRDAVPEEVVSLYESAPIHTMAAGERAVLAVLRTLPDTAFRALPFGSEGLWSKFMKNCRSCASVEEIIDATKSKRYTRTRIQRMLLCAFLGLTAADLERQPPYVRVLGFTDRGRAALREMKKSLETRRSAEPGSALQSGDGSLQSGDGSLQSGDGSLQSGDGSLIELVNAGETPPDPAYYALESRAADLYSLFSEAGPRPAGEENRLRVVARRNAP